ncbi:MAG TPA: DUF1801 domain-containing protein [Candidatus Aminicenantes bacterium]|nr:DUF1801 domain-containing protein [Candidatus Aminicenantes bacterium]HDT13067.1 DUF1801 domain-containing protein [Candidatus Aminicenantes bacterium]
MKKGTAAAKSVDAYIAGFPPDVREVLRKIRATILKAAPDAEEKIRYGMPAYAFEGPLVYFAAFEKHISFFPTSSGVDEFRRELAAYKTSKGTVRFPLGTRIPHGMIARIVKFRVQENRARAAEKRQRA